MRKKRGKIWNANMSKLKIEDEISCCPVLEETGLALAELLPLFPDRLFCALALNYFVNP